MRRLLIAFVLPAALLATRARADTRIGYVDLVRASQEVDEGKAATAQLKGELESRKAAVDAKRVTLEAKKAEFDKQSAVYNDETKKKKMEEMQKMYMELQQSASESEQDLQGQEAKLTNSILQRMLQVVSEISEKEGMAFVLDKRSILVGPPAQDITNEVVRRYNERFKAAGVPGAKAAGVPGAKAAEKKPAAKK